MTPFVWAQAVHADLVYVYLLPLVAVVSVVYSATRHEDWSLIWGRASRLAVMILIFMAVMLAVLWGIHLMWL
jgi:hypothetical protein